MYPSLKRLFTILLLSLAATVCAQSTDSYPNRPVKLIIPFPPGGSNDVVGRMIGAQLALRLGQPVVVDNKGGAGGLIGTEQAAKSEADGYTLLFVSSAYTANGALYKLPYDPAKAFAPVAMLASGPNVLAVPPSLPVNSVRELIAMAKANPGKLNYASAGIGSFQHLGGALFVNMAQVDIVHVPYKGGGPAMLDVMAGNPQIIMGALVQTLPQIKAGKFKALAVGGAKRSPALPDVPTLSEAGVPGYEAVNWWGIVVPAGTPKGILDRLHRELSAVQKLPEMVKRFEAEAVEPVAMTQAEFGRYLEQDTAKWARLIKEAGITAQ